jgi:site-specific recombinase XerD
MAIADKHMLIKNLENQLSDVLTATALSQTLGAVTEVLTDFSVESTAKKGETNSDELLDAFISAKTVGGRSEQTINRYRYVVKSMLKQVNVPINRINVYHLRNYMMYKKDTGSSERTIEGYREVFSSFFGWLYREKLIDENPCANLEPIKQPKMVKNPFMDVEIEMIREVCETDRDKALINFLLSTGCRVNEVSRLNVEDIDFQNLEVKVLGKGNKERIVFLDDITAMLLKRYLKNRKNGSEALFCGKRSNRMTTGGIRFALKTLEKKAGVQNVHPHRFRRTLATNLINRGMSIHEVAAILGHENINTTMTYVKVDKRNVKNAYLKYA